jgi:hypothetical protein
LCARPSRPADTITTATPVRPGAKRDDKALTVHMETVSAAWFASPAMARPILQSGASIVPRSRTTRRQRPRSAERLAVGRNATRNAGFYDLPAYKDPCRCSTASGET